MAQEKLTVEIYGADIVCASCVNAPSSKDTYEWLEAAITRKFPGHQITFLYIDIEKPIEDEKQLSIANQIANDEFFYPLIMINEEVIGEGYIQLKPVFSALEKYGYIAE
ncbi:MULTISPECIES: YuzD family protein [Psychrobacillus]|uniref:YuzD family protein n=1 Tax=Psychrobacillus faecigallinarum TaxID=2762235 RepID=A0ABR8RD63_9BACI|nr:MULTISPECIES: YuzD family protein [Psychrobacillus]MBD7945735.1 YuzD family protein [Psychrobacillus faecigallinarum]QEY22537.1 DUF1462 family protein [Psychrobacillus sp. AK 1817]